MIELCRQINQTLNSDLEAYFVLFISKNIFNRTKYHISKSALNV